MFEHGTTFERYFEIEAGVLWVSAKIHVENDHLYFTDLLIYPATGARMSMQVVDLLEIASFLEYEARLQGFTRLTLQAERVYAHKPARILTINRRLR